MRPARQNHDLMMMCHPYLFALKEGHEITQNFFDYSLLLMQRHCTEIVNSPSNQGRGIMMVEPRPFFVQSQQHKIIS